ncbi:GNAT family N-acetyltransferase [Methylobacterium sp. J-092]|uniref:GNAT family N-acetyltransferase n=1 Tax=Methylobacterium sp. J-092 TaxID=2836667 RepID=UPI001FBAC943|nr:GNAT family N-acetyltransferase [Methylobacterium sp. J-092]MCJ2008958.1 GNAT family N-acetyltransferase [Methylobacterium sp. J-092]
MFPDLTRDDVFRIETRSLWLRWPRAKDVDAIVRRAGDRSVAEMTARIRHPIDRMETETFVLEARRCNAAGEGLAMAVSLRSDPDGLVGFVGIRADAATEGARLGYWLGRPFWGRGLATEAAEAMVHAYFAYAGGSVLSADARVENPASRRVLEKVGFVRTGTATDYVPVRGCDLTSDRFRLDRAAWSARFGVSGCDRAA